jgi:hypothetical protein
MQGATSSSGFADNRDPIWVTAEFVDILLNPLKSESLIMKTSIGSSIRLKGGT